MLLQEQNNLERSVTYLTAKSSGKSPTSLSNSAGSTYKGQSSEFIDGSSLLHLTCETRDIGMLELLLQYGANTNASDSKGETPLHCCILGGRAGYAKLLIARGADPQAVNKEGKTPLRVTVESNFNDSEALVLLSGSDRSGVPAKYSAMKVCAAA